jgi:pimeloyl-ACP methyl ester carboxylesterase
LVDAVWSCRFCLNAGVGQFHFLTGTIRTDNRKVTFQIPYLAADLDRRTFLSASATGLAAGFTPVAGQPTVECREDLTMILPDGRRLGYATYGDPEGWPVLHFHGIPTSRLEGRFFAAAAARRGCRLVCPDRPGYGTSDFQPNRTVCNWLHDICHFLEFAERFGYLDLSRFSVSCFSSGAAYGLLLARHLPASRLRSVAVVDGIAPLEKIEGCGGTAQIGFNLARRNPRMARALFNLNTRQIRRRPDRVLKRTAALFSRCDRSLFTEPRNARYLIDIYLECVRCGPQGVVHDMQLLSCPWGFSLEAIELPVRLYYGACDVTTPERSMGRCLHRSIRHSSLAVVPRQGHLSMWNFIGDTLFTDLRDAATR